MTRCNPMLCSTLWIALLASGAAISAGAEEMTPEPKWRDGVRTEWAIAPEGAAAPARQLPEGTVLQEETVLPAGTILPGGALLPAAPTGGAAPDSPAASASNAADADTATGVPYLSGGIGVSGREEMEEVKSKFNLRLLFAVKGSGSYLADVKVRIDDAAGPTLLEAVSQGPWFYASLAPGRYVIRADNAGQTQTREVTVPASGAAEQSFYWSD